MPHRGVFLEQFSQNLQILYPVSGCVSDENFDRFAQGVTELWGFKIEAVGFPQIFSATMRRTSKSFPDARMCSRSSITMPSFLGRILPAAGAAKNVEVFVCLSVCLSATLLNVRVCVPNFAMKALEYRNDFDAVG